MVALTHDPKLDDPGLDVALRSEAFYIAALGSRRTHAGRPERLKELGHGHLHVVHCGARSRELLSGLGLDQIFSIHSNGSTAPDCESLGGETPAKEESKKEQAQTMLEAHEALCEAAPENILRFKDVLDFLRQDLHHETSSK